MSADWDGDDLARLLALEHAFRSLALIGASNYALLNGTTVSDASAQFRDAIVGSVYDTALPDGLKKPMHTHLGRMFDQVGATARQADAAQEGMAPLPSIDAIAVRNEALERVIARLIAFLANERVTGDRSINTAKGALQWMVRGWHGRISFLKQRRLHDGITAIIGEALTDAGEIDDAMNRGR